MIPRIVSKLEAYVTPMRLITSIALVIDKTNTKHFDKLQFWKNLLPYICFVTTHSYMYKQVKTNIREIFGIPHTLDVDQTRQFRSANLVLRMREFINSMIP